MDENKQSLEDILNDFETEPSDRRKKKPDSEITFFTVETMDGLLRFVEKQSRECRQMYELEETKKEKNRDERHDRIEKETQDKLRSESDELDNDYELDPVC